MRTFVLALCLILGGCCSFDEYVEADARAWENFDPYIDQWINSEVSLTSLEKDALHSLNAGRRARIRHAQEGIADVRSSS